MNIDGPDFAALARQALEAKYGGEIDNLLNGLDQSTIQNPGKFASELFNAFGTGAMRYYVTIVEYVESGRFQPEEDEEVAKEEEELESLVHDIESNSERGTTTNHL